MSVRLNADGAIVLEGSCPVEDAEPLQRLLLEHPEAALDWHLCDAAHTAVLQVLLVGRPAIQGVPRAAFLQRFILPVLTGRIPECTEATFRSERTGVKFGCTRRRVGPPPERQA